MKKNKKSKISLLTRHLFLLGEMNRTENTEISYGDILLSW